MGSSVKVMTFTEGNPITDKEIDIELRKLFESLKATQESSEIKTIKAKVEVIKHILKTQLLRESDLKKELVI